MATTAQTGAPGGHKAPFPPFQSETFVSQLFWLAIAFTALYLLASRLLLPRVGGIIDARAKRIADDLEEAQQFKAAADAANAAYEKALADARSRAQALANATREKQQAEAGGKRKALEQQLDAKLAEAEKTIAATKVAAMGNVRSIATDAAAAIVTRLTGTEPSGQAVAAAVGDALKR
ncbi:MAG TPA: F0F1 ATP synthase subunit B' [Xanthobacteraceae bacterium]|nr:F0F1 ATP synthase subunit B' [Xanthobacteraceae bacterium]